MYDTVIVRIALIIYVVIAGSVVFLLGRNSAAPDSLKNVGILMASILPVLIAVLPYLNPEKIEKHFTFALFFDAKDKKVISGNAWNPYSSSYIHMFTNLSQVPDALDATSFADLMESKGLNIIEKGIIQALLMKFSNHWDIEAKKFEGPASTSESWSSNSKLETKPVKLVEIQEVFKHNPLITKQGVLTIPNQQICLPPKCKIGVETTDKSRSIILKNPYATVKIVFHASSGMVAQQGIWGVLTPDPANMNRYYIVEYRVDVTLLINRTKVYSPEMKNYRKWFENICDILSGYDWNVVDKKIEKSLNRDAISKTLGR